jgi:hypothetical protein
MVMADQTERPARILVRALYRATDGERLSKALMFQGLDAA